MEKNIEYSLKILDQFAKNYCIDSNGDVNCKRNCKFKTDYNDGFCKLLNFVKYNSDDTDFIDSFGIGCDRYESEAAIEFMRKAHGTSYTDDSKMNFKLTEDELVQILDTFSKSYCTSCVDPYLEFRCGDGCPLKCKEGFCDLRNFVKSTDVNDCTKECFGITEKLYSVFELGESSK